MLVAVPSRAPALFSVQPPTDEPNQKMLYSESTPHHGRRDALMPWRRQQRDPLYPLPSPRIAPTKDSVAIERVQLKGICLSNGNTPTEILSREWNQPCHERVTWVTRVLHVSRPASRLQPSRANNMHACPVQLHSGVLNHMKACVHGHLSAKFRVHLREGDSKNGETLTGL